MKKLLIVLCALLLGTGGRLCAEEPASRHTFFQFGFVPPLSTNGPMASSTANTVSINLLMGSSYAERGFGLSGLTSIARHDMSGVQIAGLYNHAGHRGRGVLIGGIGNSVRGTMEGVQIGGLLNLSNDLRGVQISSAVNRATRTEGVQIGGLLNLAQRTRGVQVAGAVNLADAFDGFQLAGFTNVARDLRGMQLAGLGNVANDVEGMQLGLLFNKADRVHGVQMALLVNVAEQSDCPIGIVNIIRNGEMALALGYDDLGALSLTFRSGGRYTYGILGFGYLLQASGRYTAEVGLGATIHCCDWFRIRNEVTVASLSDFSSSRSALQVRYALLPSFRIGRHVELFGGPSLALLHGEEEYCQPAYPIHTLWQQRQNNRLTQLRVGWQCGLQYIF